MRFLSSIFLGSILVGVGQAGELANVCYGYDLQPVRDFIKLTERENILDKEDGLLFTKHFTEFTTENFLSIVKSLLDKAAAGQSWCYDISDFAEKQGENLEGLAGFLEELFGHGGHHECVPAHEGDDCEEYDDHDDDDHNDDHDDEDHDDDDHDERKRRDEDDDGEDDEEHDDEHDDDDDEHHDDDEEDMSPDQIMAIIRDLGGDFRKLINTIMDDINNPEAVRKFKNFITQISNYMTAGGSGRTHLQRYFEYMMGDDAEEIPQENMDFFAAIIEQFNMYRPSSRSGMNEFRQGCNEMINMVADEYRMKFKPKLERFHQIYKKFFGAETKYDSPGIFINSIYSLVRHFTGDGDGCWDVLTEFERLAEAAQNEFQRQFGNSIDEDLEDVFDRKDTYKAKQMEDKLMNIMQEKMTEFGWAFHNFLKRDINHGEEQNAMRAWFIITGKAKRVLQMMPELWDWAKTDMRADFNEMGFDMNDIPFDIGSVASRQAEVMDEMVVMSTCGQTATKQCAALSNYEQEYTMAAQGTQDEDGGLFGDCFVFCSASGIVPALALLLGLLFA